MKGQAGVGLKDLIQKRIQLLEKFVVAVSHKELRNPTLAELEQFLKNDRTDGLPYYLASGGTGDLASFVCGHFAGTLSCQVKIAGIRMGKVTIFFEEGIAYAINAVEIETNEELIIIFIEPQTDQLTSIERGEKHFEYTIKGVIAPYR